MPHGFEMYRVFISAPGDLDDAKETCRAAIGQVNETEAMPHKTLLVAVGLPTDDQIVAFRSAVSDNVRQCSFYIQIFEDDWGPKNLFRKAFYLATECRDDSSLPMREIVVCLKATPRETDTEILGFRKELEESKDVRVFNYSNLESLKAHLVEICTGWARSLIRSAAPDAIPGNTA